MKGAVGDLEFEYVVIILSVTPSFFFMTIIGVGMEGAWIRMFGGRNDCGGALMRWWGVGALMRWWGVGVLMRWWGVGAQIKGAKMLRQRI